MNKTTKKNRIEVVGAVFFRKNQDGGSEVLLFRRKQGNSGVGKWEFPGGKVELDENEEQALIREIQEELGVQIKVLKAVGWNLFQTSEREIYLKVFLVKKLTSSDFALIDHDEMKWCSAETIKEIDVSEPDIPLISSVFETVSELK